MSQKRLASPICIWDVKTRLGEGPVWIESEQALYFVGILDKKIFRYHPYSAEKQEWNVFCKPCFLFPTNREALLCGMEDGLYWFYPETGSLFQWLKLKEGYPHNRINDGYIDSKNRLWFGTMDDKKQYPNGSLYLLDWKDDQPRISRKDQGYVVSNGPVISVDKQVLYHNHTAEQQIYCFDLDSEGENLSGKRLFASCDVGYPDGMAVDEEGNLWVGLYKGHQINCYTKTGQLKGIVPFNVPNITKIAFGGHHLKTAFVTTATDGIEENLLTAHSMAGALFSFEVDIPGCRQNIFTVPKAINLKQQVFQHW